MAKARGTGTSFGNGLTSTSASRRQAAAPDSTKAPAGLRNPGRAAVMPAGASAEGHSVTLSAHSRPPVITAPPWERMAPPSVPSGPPLRGTKASGANPA